mgnify:CR=1 FL=1
MFIRDFQMQDSFTLSRFTAKPMATDITIEWSMLTARRRIADEETHTAIEVGAIIIHANEHLIENLSLLS